MNLDKEFPPARDGNVRWDGHRLIDGWMGGLIDGFNITRTFAGSIKLHRKQIALRK